MKSTRINVSLPLPVDRILTEYSAALGRSKAQIVVDALCFASAHWQRQLRALRAGYLTPSAAMPEGPLVEPVEQVEKLTRQQRRAMQREAAKRHNGAGEA